MEQNLPIIAKKVWSLVRVMFFMLKKGIAKRKFLVDLNTMMKRGKITGKALQNLMFHHHNNSVKPSYPRHLEEYEFSCNNTPPYPLSLFSTHKKHQNKRHRVATPNPTLVVDNCDDIIINDAVLKALDMLTISATSPPPLRMLTDSPFPLTRDGEEGHVDAAAEKFITRFYNDRRREN